MLDAIIKPSTGRILWMTDRYSVSSAYEPAFVAQLTRLGLRRPSVILSHIYNLIDQPLVKKGNELVWRFNPAKLGEIERAFAARIAATNPTVVVVSCPAILGVLVNGDSRLATLEKCRGGAYSYNGVPVVVSFPITVIHRRVDSNLLKDNEGEDVQEQPYKYPSGAWIFARDWEKVARIYKGERRLLPAFVYSVCRTIQDCDAALAYAKKSVAIAIDIETGCWPAQQTCIGYTMLLPDGQTRSFVIPFYDPNQSDGCFWSEDDHMAAFVIAGEINKTKAIKFMQNGNYDCSYFIRDQIPPKAYLVDVMILWWSVFMELPKSLDFISSILLDNFQYWKDDIKGIEEKDLTGLGMETYWRYCALDCYNTLFNGLTLLSVLQQSETVRANYNDAFMRAMVALSMSMRGVKADFERRDEHRIRLEAMVETATARLRYMIDDDDFNVNSPPQKTSLIYDVLGAKPRNDKGRFATRDSASSGAIALRMIKTEHPVFERVITAIQDVMTPSKQISNVCNMKLFTPRFRTAYGAVGTETTRLNSKKSNFWDGGNAQNIREEFRDWLVADPHHIFMDIDYSQSDDVFIGYESNDPDKISLIESGRDGHAVHGEMFFGMPYDVIVAGKKAGDPRIVHPTKGVRQISKRIVHGTNFIMAAMTLLMTMGRDAMVEAAVILGYVDAPYWSQERLVQLATHLMGIYRRRYKRLNANEWYGELTAQLVRTRQLTNAFGITRTFLGDPKDAGTQREAAAFIGQSDTGGNMNRCQNEWLFGYVPKHFRDGENPSASVTPLQMNHDSHGFALLLQNHDSFVIQLDTRHAKWQEAARNILTVMERPCIINGHTVRVRTEAKFGLAWGKCNSSWNGKDTEQLESIATNLLMRSI